MHFFEEKSSLSFSVHSCAIESRCTVSMKNYVNALSTVRVLAPDASRVRFLSLCHRFPPFFPTGLQGAPESSDRLLAAVLASLCSPTAQLTLLLPPSLEREMPSRPNSELVGLGGSSPDTPAFSGPDPPLPGSEPTDSSSAYPVLVEVALHRVEVSS